MSEEQVNFILNQLNKGLKNLYSDKLRCVYLFGSYARGDHDPESDFDVMVVLEDFDLYSAEIKRTSKLISTLSLEHNISISRKFIKETQWQMGNNALLRNVQTEAIAA